MHVQPYLFFDGRAEEALAFYRQALGAEITHLSRFKDNPERPTDDPSYPPEDKVMHAAFRVGDTELFASDGQCQGKPNFQGSSLALTASSASEAKRLFDALADGGQIQMPLTKTFFSPSFGMVADRFGVSWMVLAEA